MEQRNLLLTIKKICPNNNFYGLKLHNTIKKNVMVSYSMIKEESYYFYPFLSLTAPMQ